MKITTSIKKRITFFFLLFTAAYSFSQNAQNLEQIGGFRSIKFHKKIQSYNFFEKRSEKNIFFLMTNSIMNSVERKQSLYFSSQIPDNCGNCNEYVMTSIPDNFKLISGHEILKLGVATYKDTIYQISFYVKSKAGVRKLIDDHIEAFGRPNGMIGYGWDFDDFKKYEEGDIGLFMSWWSETISLTIYSIDASSKYQGSKRCAYFINYTFRPIDDRVEIENLTNTPTKDTLKQFR